MALKSKAKKATKPNAIEVELLKVLKQKAQGAKESRQEYLTRLAEKVDGDLDEKAFAKLSQETQEWWDEVVKASDKGAKEMPDFGEEPTEEEAPAKKGFGKKGKEEKEEKEEKKPAKEKAAKSSGKGKKEWDGTKDKLGYRSLSEAITHITCTPKNLDISVDDVKEKIKERGFGGGNDSYIYGRFIYVKGTIAMLKELGKL